MHKELVDNNIQVEVKKARWSQEELSIMAQKEAELTKLGFKFLNMELAKVFNSRSLEGIKGARRKPEYKQLVLDHLSTLESDLHEEGAVGDSTGANVESNINEDIFISYLRQLDPVITMSGNTYNVDLLNSIICEAEMVGKMATVAKINSYLETTFPIRAKKKYPVSGQENRRHIADPKTRSARRREEYARTQKFWSKNRSRCIKNILDGSKKSILPNRSIMETFWTNVFTQTSTNAVKSVNNSNIIEGLWVPVTETEVAENFPATSSSSGPDNISASKYKHIPKGILVRLLNLLLWTGALPQRLLSSRTIFLPKKDCSERPEDFRPITISSVMIRHLHSILAKRVRKLIELSQHQRGFIQTDGCADNTVLLDLVLRYHHRMIKTCYLCALDVSKAFDTVSHESLFIILQNVGVPREMINYLRSYYEQSYTILHCDTWQSKQISPKRGVKQGDPLSPMLFNLVINKVISSLPTSVGINIDGFRLNCVAYADDLFLFSQTRMGMQRLLDHTSSELESCGLIINSEKSLSIGIQALGKQKKIKIDNGPFVINGVNVPTLRRCDEFQYLGIGFTPMGKTKYNACEIIKPLLENLTKAPLKPQQKLYALRTVLLPRLYHQTVLGRIQIGCLKKLDLKTREYVKKWLRLPDDFPIPFIHASVKDGGLGIPSMRWKSPLLRLKKLRNLFNHFNTQNTVFDSFLEEETNVCLHRLNKNGRILIFPDQVERMWKENLQERVDGVGLSESGKVPWAHRWVCEPTRLLNGADFIDAIRLRYNCLPSRSRTTRGRNMVSRTCRGGCIKQSETTNHIIQRCPRTHGQRIKRHDKVVNYMERSLCQKGYNVLKEKRISTPVGIKIPDLIATKNNTAVIIDVQIVTDCGPPLDDLHDTKRRKYDQISIKEEAGKLAGAELTTVSSLTLNWRGVFSSSSVNDLLHKNAINKRDLAVIAVRTIIEGVIAFKMFNRSTATFPNFRRRRGR